MIDSDDRQDILRRHVAMLREHFDCVQIIASRTEGDGTARFEAGDGSWYERFGLMRGLVVRWEEGERVAVREQSDEG